MHRASQPVFGDVFPKCLWCGGFPCFVRAATIDGPHEACMQSGHPDPQRCAAVHAALPGAGTKDRGHDAPSRRTHPMHLQGSCHCRAVTFEVDAPHPVPAVLRQIEQ